MSTTPPNQPPFDPNARVDPNAPFDPTNVNDPRYDPSRDPRYDPRWQKAQQRFYRDQQRAAANQGRAATRAQDAAWRAQSRANRDQWKMYWRSQRRASIIGPLLLIALGVIFFLIHTGRVSMVNFIAWYSRWWPLLLILIGLLRLAEWAIDRARAPQDAPPMRYSVGGGVVLGVIVLICLGLATHTMQWRADRNGFGFTGPFGGEDMGHFFGQKHEEDAPAMEHALASGASLTIDNPRGDVSVSGTSDDGKVHLSVHKEVYSSSDSTANDRLREMAPIFEGADDNLRLRIPATEGASADVTLLVPAGTRVQLNSDRGDVHVTNLKSPLVVTANNGDVEVAAITGSVLVHVNNRRRSTNVRSVTGDVNVNGNGDSVSLSDVNGTATVKGDFLSGGQLERITGAVSYHSSRTDLTLARLDGQMALDKEDLNLSQAVGPVRVETRSHNITLDKVTGEVKVVNSNGTVDVHAAPPTGAITIDNQKGDVNVTLPNGTRFNLNAETSDGDTHSDFAGVNSDGRGTLSGTVNGGGIAIRINTSHGDVNVSRNSTAPLPPRPPTPTITGFGSIPQTPTPPTGMPPEAAAALEDAKKQVADAKAQAAQAGADARQQAKEAMEQAKQAMKEAQEKQKEAMRLAREAAKQKD
jgi:DUF4097 and DUF4098 domain-containing protein YvlB